MNLRVNLDPMDDCVNLVKTTEVSANGATLTQFGGCDAVFNQTSNVPGYDERNCEFHPTSIFLY